MVVSPLSPPSISPPSDSGRRLIPVSCSLVRVVGGAEIGWKSYLVDLSGLREWYDEGEENFAEM